MRFIKSLLLRFGAILLILGLAFVLVTYYPYIFARSVTGEVVAIERVDAPMAILSGSNGQPPNQIFSFALGIEDKKTKEIVTASSEDRRWAAVEKGNCATAKFFPYPPWRIDKFGTYFNARLITLMKSCEEVSK